MGRPSYSLIARPGDHELSKGRAHYSIEWSLRASSDIDRSKLPVPDEAPYLLGCNAQHLSSLDWRKQFVFAVLLML